MEPIIATLTGVLRFVRREDGQDLVEYALVVALIAFAAIAGMQTLASDINSTFGALGSDRSSLTS